MNINHVLEQFKFKGKLESCDIFGSGHINTTFLATYNEQYFFRYRLFERKDYS